MAGFLMSRREFGRHVALHGASLAAHVKHSSQPPEEPALEERLFRVASQWSSTTTRNDFWETDDVTRYTRLPIQGLHHYLWLGSAQQFRAEGCLVPATLAGEIGCFIGTQVHWDRLVAFCREFFSNPKIAPESPALIFVCLGHVTTRHAFEQNRLVAVNSSPCPGDVKVFPTAKGAEILLDFSGDWRGYRVPFDLPQGFRRPDGRSNIAIVRRRRLRSYQTSTGVELASRDFILQYSVADADPGGTDLRAIKAGDYYPNSEPYRRLLNAQGYTDSSSVAFVRTVRDPLGVWYAQQVNVNFNLGFFRGGLARHEQSDPDEVLDINTVVRPLARLFEQHPAQRRVLEMKV